jgi:Ger(x)C family germination protein
MVRKYLLFFTIIILLYGTGCWDLQEIDDKAVTTAIGLDLEEGGKLRFSSFFISPTQPGETTGVIPSKPTIAAASDYGGAIAARRILLSLSRIPEYAHIRSIVISDDLVKNNFPLAVDLLTRNRNFSPETNLLVCVASHPEEILALTNNTDRILSQLVMVNEFQLGTCVPVPIHEFIYKLLTPGIEPAIPQITIEATKPGNKITSAGDKTEDPTGDIKKLVLQGTAVFKKDKKIGVLNEYESRGFRWLNSSKKVGGLLAIKSPFNPDAYTMLEVLRFNSNTKPLVNENKIKMQIKINVRLSLYENTSGMETITPASLKKMEQAANQEISRQVSHCIRKSQELNSDILGWGLLLLQYQPDTWKQVKGNWNETFPLVEYDIKTETSIINSSLSK